ncbi:DUF4595 domain-containing protein [Bacteroides helcogenes]|uniref:DUF4595 domain-containing protein n=1 Tax=Bacteroides helcogenes (strain ATCC 35417 / DSM 20613 / JCM 6297 / CCUG 15421 / P 36-108) TaxID=693979 RepID=E6SPY1_BACT6|nr:DUF4595 domain-containing protein [Bacteroides helcogenes]ADV44960.1 hypothetical protein Bache_3029 [Bacteroides helcogenes P 36-108]MDY5239817.1 DUF4595 domain-containing protein [Bacteroides helcogenes]
MRIKHYLTGIIFCLLIAACNDKEDTMRTTGIEGIAKTSLSKIQLSETRHDDAQAVTITQSYVFFPSGWLQSHSTIQSYMAIEEDIKQENITDIVYTDHRATITDDFGNISTYILNDKGYATVCTRQEAGGRTRTYTFSYLTDTKNNKSYLTNITEIQEDGTTYASIDIDCNDLHSLRITWKVDASYEQAYTATTISSGNETANLSEIPILFLSELYPLSLHPAALYGKILGEPLPALTAQIIPDGNAESKEIVSYSYTTDERGIVTSCKEVTNSYGKNYVRTINYTIE